jgi:hypothetical protein
LTILRTRSLKTSFNFAQHNSLSRFDLSKTEAGERVVPLTDVAVSALGRIRRRAEGFGTVKPSHYVFAAFVPKFKLSGKRVVDGLVDYKITDFDPSRNLKSWRSALENADEESGLTGFPVPRSAALRDYTACQRMARPTQPSWRLRDTSAIACWNATAAAGTLPPRAEGSKAEADGSSRCEHENGRL